MTSKSVAVVLAAALLLSMAPYGVAGASGKSGTPFAITLQLVPPRLPADGGTYAAVVISLIDSSGNPSFPVSLLTVYLSSSQQNVATVVDSVIIRPGATYALANITSTVTPGNTVITASAPGLQSASVIATTATPSGFPSKLAVFVAPSTVPARPNNIGLFVVELLDQKGIPTKAGADFVVQLTSSNTRVANVSQRSIVFPQGSTEVIGGYSSSFVPGNAVIAATYAGLIGGSATVTVTGPSPFLLKVSVQPTSLSLSTVGRLMVSITDSSGNPARAPNDIVVQVRSSNTTVATVPLQATIRAGSIYALSNVTTSSRAGTATITASSSGLTSGTTQLKVTAITKPPIKLKLSIVPSLVLADSASYSSVVVSLLDQSGNPAAAHGAVTVQLTSSSPQVGSVPATVTIRNGTVYGAVAFKSTYLSGLTTVTASASNLQSDQLAQSTFGPAPTRIRLRSIPGTLLADGNSYQALDLILQDSAGNPAAAQSNLTVQLLSTNAGVLTVVPSVTIAAGSLHTIATLTTSTLPGSSNLTASIQGFTTSGLVVNTKVPAPSNLAGFISPPVSLFSSVSAPPMLVVQLQDSSGNPARARTSTRVQITSSNAALLSTPISLTIPQGSNYVVKFLHLNANGSGTLTITSQGLSPSSAKLSVRSPTIVATITPPTTGIYSDSPLGIRVNILVEGQPLPGVQVSWNQTLGRLSVNSTITSASGATAVTFTPTGTGNAKVVATLSHPAIGMRYLTSVIVISDRPVEPQPSLLQKILSYLIFVVPVVIVVVALVLFLAVRNRRRKAREELEAGFQTLS